ncbi:glycosyltransferase [Kamptonema cortianum]|uniref:Glycosyltransferase n=1 Tax=Geitlerinema calcuttense NRMC-F 0142 TaxID=2922238 RepID=A0ABT7M0E8_9CYAN|nr:glycosyltransferase [Geitlerinema calcuttense]MDK3158261.1 glycosyltransferase [Kamptonema cortianum]MDL5056521.1 glycosyltransferase [Geitlerinema calcuttense NRMC-F 0142]
MNPEQPKTRIALFMSALDGGGAERIMLYLARGFVEAGLEVDLVLAKAEGPLMSQIPPGVRLINLKSKRLILSLPILARYVRKQKPVALLSALEDANLVAIWTRRLMRLPVRVVVTVHNTLSREAQNATNLKRRIAPYLVKLFYPWADAVITVSQGAAEDLARLGMASGLVKVVYNPVVMPEFYERVKEPVDHYWFEPDRPPVILGVGRLERQKDFPTLIQAFAELRQHRPIRLMILGEGQDRPMLERLIQDLGLGQEVLLPGFVSNPYAYMAKSSVFVLSSLFEGLPTALIEAMAAGIPVVSTDCESGPREILINGQYGPLVPIGDVTAMAEAIAKTLDSPVNSTSLKQRALDFSLEKAIAQYRQVLGV